MKQVAISLCIFKLAIFLVSICHCIYWCNGCVEEERTALLQIKDSINHPSGSFLDQYWVGEDCCNWVGIQCNQSSSSVTGIDLFRIRDLGLGTWYPNATLFAQFKELNRLSLIQNNIGGWVMPQAFSKMQRLETLELWDNNLNDKIDSLCGICELKNLRSLDLSFNNLDGRTFHPCVSSNFSMLEVLYLDGNNLGSSPSVLTGLCGLRALQALQLTHNKLNSLPICLSNLSMLEDLDLSENDLAEGSFGNSIQGLCGLKALRRLDLSRNKIKSLPMCLGNLHLLQVLFLNENNLTAFLFGNSMQGLKRLEYLKLSNNDLTDEGISPWISNLTSLTMLNLRDNHLKDSNIVKDICKLWNLKSLHLSMNSFVGNIQPCLGDLHNITYIDLSKNQFSGLISFSMFANLSKLSYIYLSHNTKLQIETDLPSWIPTFQLRSLNLQNCIINNSSGGNIPTFISTQRELQYLDLTNTSLRGTIPSWLLYNVTTHRSISMRENSLVGPFPMFTQHNLSKVFELDISNNIISDVLPPTIGALLPNLSYLNMSTNAIKGNIPLSLSELKQLKTLDLSENKFSGEIPHSFTKNGTFLEYLSLSNNRLWGEILSRDSNMTRLLVLVLNGNNFNGSIPSSLLSSSALSILDVRENKLSGIVPSWLHSLINLTSLLLGGNSFDGPIPTELCRMQNLHMLDLSRNNISGRIPSCFNNVTSWKEEIPIQIIGIFENQFTEVNPSVLMFGFSTRVTTDFTTKGIKRTYEGRPFMLMTGIDLSMNHLIGDIPFQIGELKELRSLNLSNNILSGPFPNTFQNLANMESLDLSHNTLVGTIPPQIIQLHSLSTFSVAFNNLSGTIPYEFQFSTFSDSSYMGNPGLCGLPVQRNCSSNIVLPSQDKNAAKEDSGIPYNPMFFYSGIASSFALGFWGFIALLFWKNFQRKLFIIVDGCYDYGCVKFIYLCCTQRMIVCN